MSNIRGGSCARMRLLTFAFLLFSLLILPACSAVDSRKATPESTSSILIPLVEQAGAWSTDISNVTPAEQDGMTPSDIDCTSLASLTPSQTEGPFYKSGSPERTSLLEEGMRGTRLMLTGYVLKQDCQPIPGAWLDFWQTDDQGEYDNQGYYLRGHQYTDENGRYQLETIIPGEYPGRTEHIHVKVQAPEGPILTTQLYFPGVAGNEADSIFSPQNLVDLQETDGGFLATFNFVIEEK